MLDEYEEVEDEFGFRYMRKKQKLSAPAKSLNEPPSTPVSAGQIHLAAPVLAAASNYVATPSTPTPSKQVLENNRRRRRSSFAVLAAAAAVNSTDRHSLIGSSLVSSVPPVGSAEFHKHLIPDLPGPVKMRQLLLWACQRASQDVPRVADSQWAEDLIQAVTKGDIETSWYQRPSEGPSGAAASSVIYLPNPQNQDIQDCIDLYRNYQQRLEQELRVWEALDADREVLKENVIGKLQAWNLNETTGPEAKAAPILSPTAGVTIEQLSSWLARDLPLSVDRLDWTCKLATTFQDHAKQFCESVFHEIFAKFFASDGEQRVEPMLVLRAMSLGGARAS